MFKLKIKSSNKCSGFAPRPAHQGCNGGKLLATWRRFDRFGI